MNGQVLAIAALHLAIAFAWMAYGLCQPQVLSSYGVADLILPMAAAQGLLGAIIEPLTGSLSDGQLRRRGTRFLGIAVGVTVTGLLFISVAVALEASPPRLGRWLLPVLMLLWVAAMNTFRSPSLALLKRAVDPAELPMAAAMIAVVGGLVRGIEPLLPRIVATLGGPLTFVAGAAVLGLASLPLLRLLPRRAAPLDTNETTQPMRLNSGALLFAAGAGAGLLQTLIVKTTPLATPAAAAEVQAGILVAGGLLSLVVGRLGKRYGSRVLLAAGMAVALAALLSLYLPSPIVAILLSPAALALLSAAATPLVLTVAPTGRAGLAVGLFSGGAALGSMLHTLGGFAHVHMLATAATLVGGCATLLTPRTPADRAR